MATPFTEFQLKLNQLLGENTPEALSTAISDLESGIRAGIVPDAVLPAAISLQGQLLSKHRQLTSLRDIKNEIALPQALGQEKIIELQPTPEGGFALPSGTRGEEVGRAITSEIVPHLGKRFAKAIVREPSTGVELPRRLTSDQLFRLAETGMEGLIPQLQPEKGATLTAAQIQSLGEAGIPSGGRIHAAEISPEEFQQANANEQRMAQMQREALLRVQLAEKMDSPIGITLGARANNFFDKETALKTGQLKVLPASTSVGKALSEGIELDNRTIQGVQDANRALIIAKQLEAQGKPLFQASKPFAKLLQAGSLRLGAFMDDPDVANFATSGGLLMALAGSLQGEHRISDRDVVLVGQTVGLRFIQSPEGFTNRIKRLEELFKGARDTMLGISPEGKTGGNSLEDFQRFLKERK